MHQKSPVRDIANFDSLKRIYRFPDLLSMGSVSDIARDVDGHPRVGGLDNVYPGDLCASAGYSVGDIRRCGECSRSGDSDGNGIAGLGVDICTPQMASYFIWWNH